MMDKIEINGKDNIVIDKVKKSTVIINIDKSKERFNLSEKSITVILIITFFSLSFVFGLIKGTISKNKSNDTESLKRYITSQVQLSSYNNTYYLVFKTIEKNYIYNTQTDSLTIRDKYQKDNTNLSFIKNSIPKEALVFIGVSGSLYEFYKLSYKTSSKNAKIIYVILGTISTYYIGYWLTARKIPDTDNTNLNKALKNVDMWKEIEVIAVDRFLSSVILKKNKSNIFPLKQSLFTYTDTTKIKEKQLLRYIYFNENKFNNLRERLLNGNGQIYSLDFETIIDRERYLKIIWNVNFLNDKYITNKKPLPIIDNYAFNGSIQKIDL